MSILGANTIDMEGPCGTIVHIRYDDGEDPADILKGAMPDIVTLLDACLAKVLPGTQAQRIECDAYSQTYNGKTYYRVPQMYVDVGPVGRYTGVRMEGAMCNGMYSYYPRVKVKVTTSKTCAKSTWRILNGGDYLAE